MMAKGDFRRPIFSADSICIDPSQRLCPQFDETSIAAFPIANPGEKDFRDADSFAEVHIM